ncbi:MAG TPA: signal recognition particle protein [Longimicrobiales bacterium]|nr:signal recognition particle protein [Longimicrobiales bacterium]
MFEELSEKLDGVFSRLRQRGLLTEAQVHEGLREVRRILLEADVNFQLVKDFLARVEEQALGERVLKSVSPGQQIVKIVNDELIRLLGEKQEGLKTAPVGPTVILLAGLQGSGKTTTAAKLAKRLAREGRNPLLAALDVYRPAAIDQLETLGRQVNVPVFSDRTEKDVAKLAQRALAQAGRDRHRALILDTAGRLQIDADLMAELKRVSAETRPTEVLLVVDAMIGQEAVRIAQGFHDALGLTGVILTKLDGDARGGAALSIRGVTGVPIKYVGVGEKTDGLEVFDPTRMAGRILQQGDVVGLVEKAQEAFDEDDARRLERKVAKEGKFDLNDFLGVMSQLQKMGPMEGLLKMVPGVNAKLLKQAKLDPKTVRHVEAIVLSMTPKERAKPDIINGSRRLRIAKGSGRTVQEVNRLLDQFKQMQKMMKSFKGMGLGKGKGLPRGMGMPRLPGMFGT